MHRCIYGIVHPEEHSALRTLLEKEQRMVGILQQTFNDADTDRSFQIRTRILSP